MSTEDAKSRREGPLDTPSNLGSNASKDIAAALTALLANVFALYVKTKNFHWHISGPHFRDYPPSRRAGSADFCASGRWHRFHSRRSLDRRFSPFYFRSPVKNYPKMTISHASRGGR